MSRISIGAIGLLLLLLLFHAQILRAAVSVLIVQDTLEPAAAIVVAGGGTPFREMEGAELFHAGWAPIVIIVRPAVGSQQKALNDLGMYPSEEWQIRRDVLLKLGVPAAAIVVPDRESYGTLEELQAVADMLDKQGKPVILVTSNYHTRRVSLTWDHVTGEQPRGIVRIASKDPFRADKWWVDRDSIAVVAREYMGLVNYVIGFAVPPRNLAPGNRDTPLSLQTQ